MDEQLLHKEREVACRTRWRTSYSMTFPERLPGTGSSPTACASAPTSEVPVSEKKYKLLKAARPCKKSAYDENIGLTCNRFLRIAKK